MKPTDFRGVRNALLVIAGALAAAGCAGGNGCGSVSVGYTYGAYYGDPWGPAYYYPGGPVYVGPPPVATRPPPDGRPPQASQLPSRPMPPSRPAPRAGGGRRR